MIQLRPGDLISIEHNGIFFYAFVITKIKLFGGNLLFGFHKTTKNPLQLEEVLNGGTAGFMSLVDLIQFKRAGTIHRLGKNMSVPYATEPKRYKQTFRKQEPGGYIVRLFDDTGEYLGEYNAEKKSDLPAEILEFPEYSTNSSELFTLNVKRKWHQSMIEALYLDE